MASGDDRDGALPLSELEAKRVAAALLAQPIAVLVWVVGLFLSTAERASLPVFVAMGVAFLVNAVAVMIVLGLTVRIAGRSERSLMRTLLDFNFRIPWSLMMGALGRKTYDRAGWSPRLLMFQRAIFVVCFGGIVGWMLFVILQVGSESA